MFTFLITRYLVVGKNVYIFKNEISRRWQKIHLKKKHAAKNEPFFFFFTAVAAKGLKPGYALTCTAHATFIAVKTTLGL